MFYKPNTAYYGLFCITDATGAAANADSLPTATATKNGSDDGAFALTVANVATGRYKITGTVPSGYAAGDRVQISVAATVGGIASLAVVDSFGVDTKYVGSLNDVAAGAQMDLVNAPNNTALTALANKVEAEIIDDTDSEKVLEAITNKIAAVNPSLAGLTLAAIASQVRTELTTELGRIDAAVSSRLATADYTAPPSAATVASQVRTELATELGRVDVAVSSRLATASYAAAPTAAANADAVWDEARSDHVASGSFGEGVKLASGALTTAAIADGAITSAKFTVQTLTGVASGILEKIAQVWHWFFGAVELTDETMKTKTGDTVITTQAVSYDGVTETRGAAE